MKKLALYVLSCCFLVAAGSSFTFVYSDVNAARQDAISLIERGQRIEAGALLLENLRAIPRSNPDAAMSALGDLQLLMFLNENLLHEDEAAALYSQPLDEIGNEMDRLIAVNMRYGEDSAMTQDEANKNGIDATQLAKCQHLPVRLNALFIMSSPYYFADTPGAQKAVDQILKDFPDHFLAKEAQRLALYSAGKNGAAGLLETLERETAKGGLREHSLRMQEDSTGQVIYSSVAYASHSDADASCASAISQAAATAASSEEEYAALNILQGFGEGPAAPQAAEAATAAIQRNHDPLVVFRANILRVKSGCALGDEAVVTAGAEALLQWNEIPVAPDRNNYEEFRKCLQEAADFFLERGKNEQARALLTGLADRFPGSKLSERLEKQARAV